MSATAVRQAALEELRLLDVKDAAKDDPKALINEIRFFDPSTEEWVEFKMFSPEGWETPLHSLTSGDLEFDKTGASDWYWQSVIIDWLHDPELKKYLIYKARQLGITLLCCAYALWLMLFRPGAVCVAYSFTQDEAQKLAVACWAMFSALPLALRNHVEVIAPQAQEPSEWIKLRHKDGRTSSFQALPATKKHGHGARVTFAIMDEVAYQDYARDIYTAINPAVNRGHAKLAMVSTANGVSNKETGEGNFFHHVYATKKEKGLRFCFLPWNAEPTRSEEWYATEAMALDEVERNRQYPLNEADGFMYSGLNYFDKDGLAFYRENPSRVRFAGQFVITGRRKAEFMHLRDGVIEVYEEPRDGHSYAIGVDTSTGKAADYTSATVIDLASGTIVAHLHAKMEAPRAAIQIHFLGKWFYTAKLCIERQGGYGEALVYALRDGNQNIPVYPNLYQHKRFTSASKPISDDYGHPMGESNRGQILDGLKQFIRERLFPFMPAMHMDELGTFAYADTKPSPRAQDGCNDDCVMSLGLAAEMYRQYGQRPAKKTKFKKAKYKPPPTRVEHR